MSKIYKALAPYRKGLMAEAATKGWPLVRHLLLEFPDDREAWTEDGEFMLGHDFLVAPVTQKCASVLGCSDQKDAYLPPGRWVHLWSGRVYGDLGAGRKVTVAAPLGRPAVFYREDGAPGRELRARLAAEGLL